MGGSASTLCSSSSSFKSVNGGKRLSHAEALEGGRHYLAKGDLLKAEEYFLMALEESKALYGEDNVETLAVQDSLAVVYCQQGHFQEAQLLHQQVFAQYSHLLGSKHPLSLASQHNLGVVLFQSRRYCEAAGVFHVCYHGRTAVLGSSHADTLASMKYLAMSYLEERRFIEAEEALRGCLSKQRFLLGPDHHIVVALSILQCRAFEGMGRYDDALTLCRSAWQALCPTNSSEEQSSSPLPSTSSSGLRSWRYLESHADPDTIEARKQCQSYLEYLENLSKNNSSAYNRSIQ
eukprot:gene2515-2755_t